MTTIQILYTCYALFCTGLAILAVCVPLATLRDRAKHEYRVYGSSPHPYRKF